MKKWELHEEHLGRLALGTLLTLLILCIPPVKLLIGTIGTFIGASGLIGLCISVIVLLTIGYWVGKWILG